MQGFLRDFRKNLAWQIEGDCSVKCVVGLGLQSTCREMGDAEIGHLKTPNKPHLESEDLGPIQMR